jgi:transcriptional regulator with XRE-family HTH domain
VYPIPVDQARNHIARVRQATGMTLRQYAEAAGIQEKWFNEIVRGQVTVVTAEVARRIWSVDEDTPRPPAGRVDSTGTVRRLRALAVAGWSAPQVAKRIGMCADQVIRIRRGDRALVLRRTADRVSMVYRELWLCTPDLPEGHVARIRRDAIQRRWKAGACWEDIDDPECKPVGMRTNMASR